MDSPEISDEITVGIHITEEDSKEGEPYLCRKVVEHADKKAKKKTKRERKTAACTTVATLLLTP